MPIICPRCHAENLDKACFCRNCGMKLEAEKKVEKNLQPQQPQQPEKTTFYAHLLLDNAFPESALQKEFYFPYTQAVLECGNDDKGTFVINYGKEEGLAERIKENHTDLLRMADVDEREGETFSITTIRPGKIELRDKKWVITSKAIVVLTYKKEAVASVSNPVEQSAKTNAKDAAPEKQKSPSGCFLFFVVGFMIALLSIFFMIRLAIPEFSKSNDDSSSSEMIDTATAVVGLDTDSEEAVTQEETTEEQQTDHDWTGSYEFASYVGRTAGGTGIVYGLTFNMHRQGDSDDYQGTMVIDGYQTYQKANVTGSRTGRRLTIYFLSSDEEAPTYDLKQGDTLLELKWDDSESLMSWETYLPLEDYMNSNCEVSFKWNNKFCPSSN